MDGGGHAERVEDETAARAKHLHAIRVWLGVVMAGLVLSEVTAFPLETELCWLVGVLQTTPLRGFAEGTHLLPWMARVHDALSRTKRAFPFLAYGTDWLAFAHLVIALVFVGPYREPVRNKWVITFGLMACAGVFPLALIAGGVRGLPLAWRLGDCCFGVCAGVPLWLCRRHIRVLEGEA